MCLASVYLEKSPEAGKELVLSKVQSIECAEGQLVCKSLFGESVSLEGSLRLIDFSNGVVIVEPKEGAGD